MGTNADIVRGLYQNLAKGDVPAAFECIDEKIQWMEAESFLYADGNPYVGPQAVLEGVFQRLATDIDGFAVVPQNFVEGTDTVVVEGRYRGTVKATRRSFDAQFAHVWQLRDGKIIRFQQYTDTKQWAQAAQS